MNTRPTPRRGGTERRAALVRFGRLRPLADGLAHRQRVATLSYDWYPSPFGPALIAFADELLVGLAFCPRGDRTLVDVLEGDWGVRGVRAPPPRSGAVAGLFAAAPPPELPLLVRGTEFELAVWARLLSIPRGQTLSYGALAMAVGRPRAQRAVGRAVGANRIALLIPCHRVITSDGRIGGYRWGERTKRALLAREGVST